MLDALIVIVLFRYPVIGLALYRSRSLQAEDPVGFRQLIIIIIGHSGSFISNGSSGSGESVLVGEV